MSRSKGVDGALEFGGFAIEVGGSALMTLRLPSNGASTVSVGELDSISATVFGFAEAPSDSFGAVGDIPAEASLGFADELSSIFGGGCSIIANALLGVAGAPIGVAPSD